MFFCLIISFPWSGPLEPEFLIILLEGPDDLGLITLLSLINQITKP